MLWFFFLFFLSYGKFPSIISLYPRLWPIDRALNRLLTTKVVEKLIITIPRKTRCFKIHFLSLSLSLSSIEYLNYNIIIFQVLSKYTRKTRMKKNKETSCYTRGNKHCAHHFAIVRGRVRKRPRANSQAEFSEFQRFAR